jgi:hypothetical protein
MQVDSVPTWAYAQQMLIPPMNPFSGGDSFAEANSVSVHSNAELTAAGQPLASCWLLPICPLEPAPAAFPSPLSLES